MSLIYDTDMPREITFKIGMQEYNASPVKIDRRRLYGWTELIAIDDSGNPCDLLTADESGRYIIPMGGTGNGILDTQGRWVERSELKTVTEEGLPARLYESSFEKVNRLEKKVTPEQYLDYNIVDLYELKDPAGELTKVVGDDIYIFQYTYNDSYTPSPAFVMTAGDEKALFLLIGVKNIYEMLCFGDCEAIEEDHDANMIEEADEEIDFSMF